jgi:hypothetical protein
MPPCSTGCFLVYYAGVALPKALITYGWRKQFTVFAGRLQTMESKPYKQMVN